MFPEDTLVLGVPGIPLAFGAALHFCRDAAFQVFWLAGADSGLGSLASGHGCVLLGLECGGTFEVSCA